VSDAHQALNAPSARVYGKQWLISTITLLVLSLTLLLLPFLLLVCCALRLRLLLRLLLPPLLWSLRAPAAAEGQLCSE
jgi:hypothetical protein